MFGFKLQDGDIVIDKGKIQTVDGNELLRQTIEAVLGTNKGEWFLNTDEGITYSNILVKNPDFDIIKNEIIEGLKQVDTDLVLQEYTYRFDKNKRILEINFVAKNSNNNETVNGSYNF